MQLFKRVLLAAVLAVVGLSAMAVSASATTPPITGTWASSTGAITLDGSLGGTECAMRAGGPNGFSVTSATFTDCDGEAGDLTALLPWAITWNADLVSGRILVRASATVLGALCLYEGLVPFTYRAGPPRTINLNTAGARVARRSGIFICPSSVDVIGVLTI